jgi:hypothetical protein
MGDGFRVAVEGQQTAVWCRTLQQSGRVSTCPNRTVNVKTAGFGPQIFQDFLVKYGDVFGGHLA